MTKFNNRLFTLFLCLGVIFFLTVLYMIFTSGVLPSSSSAKRHTVNFNGIKIVKNNYLDTSYFTKRRDYESLHHVLLDEDLCVVKLINLTDNIPYVISKNFADIKQIYTPTTIEVFQKSSSIPNSTLQDKYKLVITCNAKIVSEFFLGDLVTFLDLKYKPNNSTEQKEMKLISKDNNLILFANFTVDDIQNSCQH